MTVLGVVDHYTRQDCLIFSFDRKQRRRQQKKFSPIPSLYRLIIVHLSLKEKKGKSIIWYQNHHYDKINLN